MEEKIPQNMFCGNFRRKLTLWPPRLCGMIMIGSPGNQIWKSKYAEEQTFASSALASALTYQAQVVKLSGDDTDDRYLVLTPDKIWSNVRSRICHVLNWLGPRPCRPTLTTTFSAVLRSPKRWKCRYKPWQKLYRHIASKRRPRFLGLTRQIP